jgi:hypothetical protein
MKIITAILYISDLLFPLWWFLIMRFSMKRGLKAWQAWGIASTFCIVQADLVAKLIGWNLGAYTFGLVALAPELLFGHLEQATFEYLYWILPPLVLTLLPMLLLYAVEKYRDKNKSNEMTSRHA